MSYLVLARKYRPRSFSEVVGQDVVTRTLAGAIQEGRVGHAYLFCGPRGTGKTTSARLFAKALNCEKGPTTEPCGECERCVAADSGTEVDLVEIDAASNTGVDYVRDLRDQAAYVPLRARFKVFVVDEVHMLSKAAFNALLKTLEEPPPHVKFLFATTEPGKLPDTILSRCQILRLAPIPAETIRERLDEVFRREGVEAGEGVTAELARRARGGMRDALSMADQLLALVGTSPVLADVERLSSEGSASGLERVVGCLVEGDRAGILSALPRNQGGEAELIGGLLDHLRGCLLLALCGAQAPMLSDEAGSTTAGEREALAERGKRLGSRRLELMLQELLHARERMRVLPSHARLVLEVTLLDLCRDETCMDLAEIEARLSALEAGLPPGAKGSAASPAPPPAPSAPRAPQARRGEAAPAAAAKEPVAAAPPPSTPAAAPDAAVAAPDAAAAPRAVAPAPTAAPAAAPTVTPAPRRAAATNRDTWTGFLELLESSAPALSRTLARRGRLVGLAADVARIQLDGTTPDEQALLKDERNRRLAQRAFSQVAARDVDLHIEDATGARSGNLAPFTNEVARLFEGNIQE